MTPEVILIAIELVALTKLDGRTAYVNPAQVVQLQETKTGAGLDHNTQVTDEVGCVIRLLDGDFVSVRETCDEVRKLFIVVEKNQ